MGWQTLSLHFKQQYHGGYRYLDRCGEFMLAAVEKMNFMPGEAKPTGANLEIPERGLSAALDTLQLVVVQEMPGEDHEFFLQTVLGLVELAQEHFRPKSVIRNGFACKSYWEMAKAEQALAASLRFCGSAQDELGKLVDMVPAHKRSDFNFSSGSLDLHVLLHPVTFEKVTVNRHNPNFTASATQKHRIERLNQFADRFRMGLAHALLLELDLMEVDPPQDTLEKHFKELHDHTNRLRKHFAVK